jgi:hypothetical protein
MDNKLVHVVVVFLGHDNCVVNLHIILISESSIAK